MSLKTTYSLLKLNSTPVELAANFPCLKIGIIKPDHNGKKYIYLILLMALMWASTFH